MTDLGTLGGVFSQPIGINNSGQVVGVSDTAGGKGHAFLYDGGVMTDLGTLGGGYSIPTSINNSGQVVGYSDTADGERHAFLYSGGVMTDLGNLGDYYIMPTSINDSGQVVGIYYTADIKGRAFLYSGGVMTDLGNLGGSESFAFGINNSGQVVGGSNTASGETHAFLYDGGVMTDLNTLIPQGSAALSYADAINNKGQILARNLQGRAFLLTPLNDLWAHPVRPYTPGSYDGRYFFYEDDHLGEDESLAEGTAIHAIGPGIIREYRKATGYGELVVVIDHDLGKYYQFQNAYGDIVITRFLTSIYGHLRPSQLRGGITLDLEACPVNTKKPCPENSKVTRNTIIGFVNDDAHNGDGSEHLHMGIRLSNYKTAKADDPKAPFRKYEGKTHFGEDFSAASKVIESLRNNP